MHPPTPKLPLGSASSAQTPKVFSIEGCEISRERDTDNQQGEMMRTVVNVFPEILSG